MAGGADSEGGVTLLEILVEWQRGGGGVYLVDKIVESDNWPGEIQRAIQCIRQIAQKPIILVYGRSVNSVCLADVRRVQLFFLLFRDQPCFRIRLVLCSRLAGNPDAGFLVARPPQITYLQNRPPLVGSSIALLALLRRPVVVKVVRNQPEHRDIEVHIPAWEKPAVHRPVHHITYPGTFSGNQPWEDGGEAVALTVLIREEDADVENPGQYWIRNRCWVEEGNHVVSGQDHHDFDDTEGVKGRQEDESEHDIKDVPAGDIVGRAVGRGHRWLRGDGAEEKVKQPTEDKVEPEHTEEDGHVGSEGSELTVRVVNFPTSNPPG